MHNLVTNDKLWSHAIPKRTPKNLFRVNQHLTFAVTQMTIGLLTTNIEQFLTTNHFRVSTRLGFTISSVQ